MSDPGVLAALLLLPGLGALAVSLLGLPRRTSRALTAAVMAATLVLALNAFTTYRGAAVTYRGAAVPSHLAVDWPWMPSLGVSLRFAADGFNVYLLLLTALLFPAVLACAWATAEAQNKLYLSLLLTLQAALLGTFLTQNLVVLFVLWEAVLIPMVLLILVYGGPRRRQAAMSFFLYTMAGSVNGRQRAVPGRGDPARSGAPAPGRCLVLRSGCLGPPGHQPAQTDVHLCSDRAGLRREEPALPLPLVAAAGLWRSFAIRNGTHGRRAQQDGGLRLHQTGHPAVPRRRARGGTRNGGPGRGQHPLRRGARAAPDPSQTVGGLCVAEPHGLHRAGCVQFPAHGHPGRAVPDPQPRPVGGRACRWPGCS